MKLQATTIILINTYGNFIEKFCMIIHNFIFINIKYSFQNKVEEEEELIFFTS